MVSDVDPAVAHLGSRRFPHIVVVGAGIAGLTVARELLQGLPGARVTVLEAAPRTGGKLRLGEVAGQTVDLGAEAMLNRRPEAVALARDLGLGERLVHPVTTSAGIWTRGAVRRLPRTVMGIPADLARLAETGIVSRSGVRRARLERALRRVDVSGDVGVGALVSRRVGTEVRDRLVEPMLGGVYAGRADELSLHATVPQLVPAIAEHGNLLAAASAVAAASAAAASAASSPAEPVPVFAGLDGGVGSLAVALERSVTAAGAAVRCSTTVREVSRTPSGFRLVVGPTVAPEVVDADAVVVAAPAVPAARMLSPAAPSAAAELARIEYASMAVVTLALNASAAADLEGSGFLVPPVDSRQVKAATYSSRKWGWLRGDLLVVRCSVGRYGDERQLHRDDDELVRIAAAELGEAVGLRGEVVDAAVTRWGGGLPQYAVGHLGRVRRIREAVAQVPGLEVCGAAYDGLGIPACIASAQQAATRLTEHLAARETMAS
ncbi:MAG: protoporphyrinogen oxidase [Nocardioidaceae bacterium]